MTGTAYDYPHLGAAGVIADEYLPKAEGEGETDQFFPQAGIIGISPARIFNKALGCLRDNYVSDDIIILSCFQILASNDMFLKQPVSADLQQLPRRSETHPTRRAARATRAHR